MPEPTDHEPNGNGRDAGGRFAKGNSGGPGNPLIGQRNRDAARLRAEWDKRVNGSDVALAVKTLRRVMKRGKDGDAVRAAIAMLDRTVGRPADSITEERISRLEAQQCQQMNASN